MTCTASEVLKAGYGICFARSRLLEAFIAMQICPSLLFCYQKLILDDEIPFFDILRTKWCIYEIKK